MTTFAASPTSRSGSAPPRPSPPSTSPSAGASPGCSAPTAPARPRCCGSWPPRSPPTAGVVRSSGATRTARPPGRRDRAARLPAPGAGLPPRLDRLRLRRLRRRPQGVERPRAARHAEVRRVLDLVGLADLATKRICALSGGQRRRVGAGPGAARGPRISRPRRADRRPRPAQRADLRDVSVSAGQRAVLLSTHQTEDVAALCERVVVLDGGRSGSTARSPTWSPPRRAASGSPTSQATRRAGQLAHRHRPPPRRRWYAAARREPAEPTSRTPTCSCAAPPSHPQGVR